MVHGHPHRHRRPRRPPRSGWLGMTKGLLMVLAVLWDPFVCRGDDPILDSKYGSNAAVDDSSAATKRRNIKQHTHRAEVIDGCSWSNKEDCAACTLVVAPSTMEGGGLGVFTLVDLTADQPIGPGAGDLVVPIKNLPFIKANKEPFNEYSWNVNSEWGTETTFAPGLRSLCNSHVGLPNIHLEKPVDILYRNDLDSSPYHNLQGTVEASVSRIDAGSELLSSYGDQWTKKRFGKQATSLIPNATDYLDAEVLAKEFYRHVETVRGHSRCTSNGHNNHCDNEHDSHLHEQPHRHRRRTIRLRRQDHSRRISSSNSRGNKSRGSFNPPPQDLDRDLNSNGPWQRATLVDHGETVYDAWQMDLWEVVSDTISLWGERPNLDHVLPRYHDLQQVVQLGIRSLYQSELSRSLSDLMVPSTRCVDGIEARSSSIHHLGAFATRDFANGTIITGSPILHSMQHYWNARSHVWNASALSYQIVHTHNEAAPIGHDDFNNTTYSSLQRHALLINYCFSAHDLSSLLLCPYGMGANYINHGRKPNVALQWAPHGHLGQNDTYFELTPEQLSEVSAPGLAMDYVAIRDIQEGEEILLNYGRSWRVAHREFFKAERDLNFLTTDLDLFNDIKFGSNPLPSTAPLRTEAEQLTHPYPSDIELWCHPDVMKGQLQVTSTIDIWTNVTSRTMLSCSIMESATTAIKIDDTGNSPNKQRTMDDVTLYAARVLYQGSWIGRNRIPRMYFKWFARNPPRVFRFPMQMPARMAPDAWRDKS